jgi:hypothetical protein
MRRVIFFTSLSAGAAFLALRLIGPSAALAPSHFSASEMIVAAGFVTLAIAVLLRD